MNQYFLYIISEKNSITERDSEISDELEEIIKVANEVGFKVVSDIWTLPGRYEILQKIKLKKKNYTHGYYFKDSLSENVLEYPPITVERGKVYKKEFTTHEMEEYRKVKLPDGVTIRSIEWILYEHGIKRYPVSSTVEYAARLIQYANRSKKPVLYIPRNPSSCQNLVDGPLQFIDNKIVVVDWSKIFRDYADYRIIKNKGSIKEVLKELYEI